MTSKKIALGLAVTVLLCLGGIALFTDPLGLRREPSPPDGSLAAGRAARPASPAKPDAARDAGEALEALPRGEAGAPLSILGRVSSGGRGVPLARLFALDLAAWEGIDEAERKNSTFPSNSPARLRKLRDTYLKQAESTPRTTSGADGSFRFTGLPEGMYRVIASHEDYLPGVDSLATVRAGAPARCDVELAPASRISGRVVDESGRGVAGAALEAESVERSGLQGLERLERIRADWCEGRLLLPAAACESGPDGSFRLVSLEPAAHDLSARKDGYLEAKSFGIPAGSPEVILTLKRGSALTGRVLDPGGAPVKEAQVLLTRSRSAEVHRLFDWMQVEVDSSRSEVRAATDPEGRFRLEGLTAGSFDLSVSAERFPPLQKEVAHAGAPLDLGDLILEEPRSISGAVYGPAGAPAAGARVWAAPPRKQVQPSNSLRLADPEPLAETKSGTDGSFNLTGLRAGSFEVRASAEGFAEAAAVAVTAGQRGLKLVLQRGLRIQGTVVEEETSAPVSGAEVRLGRRGEVLAETDARGTFRVSGLPVDSLHGNGTTTVQVSHPSFDLYQDWNARVLGRDEKSPLRISLSRSERITGRISGPSGLPAAGARVWIEVQGLPPDAMGYNPARDLRAVSGSEGEFTMPAPAALRSMVGEIRFSVAASHLLHGRGRTGPIGLPPTGANWPEVQIVLGRSAIEGKVTDEEGRPIARARVACRRREDSASGRSGPSAPQPVGAWDGPLAYSGPDGSYRISGAEPGPSELLASALGFAPRRVELEPGSGVLRADLVLERGGAVEGRVLDSYGAAIPGAEVAALDRTGAAGPDADVSEFIERMTLLKSPSLASTRSGADGRFRLDHLPGRPLTIAARAEGHEAAALASIEPGSTEVALVLPRFGVVAGRVLATDRKQAVTRFLVDVLDKKKLPSAGARSAFNDYRVASEGELSIQDPEGRFLYDGLRPGEYLILVSAPGFDFTGREVSLQSGEEVDVEILLDPGLRVEGVVLDAETGEPVAGATIGFGGRAPPGGIRPFPPPLVSGEDGTFSVGGLRAGSYLFYASHPYYLHSSTGPLDLSAGEGQRIELKLAPAGRLEGRIKGLAGGQIGKRGVQSTLVLASAGEEADGNGKRRPGPSFNQIWADPEGRYAAENLKPGRYVLKVKKQEMERGEIVHVGPSGGFASNRPVGPEETTVLGEVEVRARETTVFDAAAP
jgi:protocatechuate 3,4-dioxygenase beta subunit